MLTAFEWSLPGGMILLVVVGVYELWREKRRKRTGKRLSATYVDEVTAKEPAALPRGYLSQNQNLNQNINSTTIDRTPRPP